MKIWFQCFVGNRDSIMKNIPVNHFIHYVLIFFNLINHVRPNNQTAIIKNSISASNVNLKFLERSNFLVGICKNAVQSDKKTDCVKDLEGILEAIQRKDIWAIKLIDAFGNIPSPFTWGQNFWYSPKITCDSLNNPFEVPLSSRYDRFTDPSFLNATSPINLQLRMIYANFTSPYQLEIKFQFLQVLHIGLCIPRSCSGADISEFATSYFNSKTLQLQNLYDIKVMPFATKVPQANWTVLLNPSVIIFGLLTITLATLALISRVKTKYKAAQCEERTVNDGSTNFDKFLSSFDIIQNLKYLYTMDTSPDFLNSIAGMRTVTCFWLITFHVIWHPMFTFDNTLQFIVAIDEVTSQLFIQSIFYVDTFFVISSFLLTFNFLKSKKRIDEIKLNSFGRNVQLYLKMVAHRYMRLAPVFLVTVLVSDILYSVLEMGTPLYINPTNDLYCKETWWYNFLFLNNFLTMDTMCVSWGWYLACEMQFFLIFLLLLFVYTKHQKTAKFLYVVVLSTSLTISYYCYYSNGSTFQFDVMYNTSANLYSKPWTRMNSYIGGIFMGWLMYEIHIKNIKLQNINITMYWIACIAFYVSSVFITYFKRTPIWIVSTFQTFGRVLLSVFIGSMIIMCHSGYGGYFNRIMSSKFFIHCNKVTYSMYMMAPVVITALFAIRRNSTHFDQITFLMDCAGVIFSTYIVSVMTVVFIEYPFIKLSEKFIK